MRARFITLASAGLLCLTLSVSVKADFAVDWQPPANAEDEHFATALRASGMVDDAARLDRVNLDWPADLTIALGGQAAPQYLPETSTISLPYRYLADAVRAQDHFEESRTDALKRGLDMVEYTLYHLLGQALTGQNDSDDGKAVERTATWLMVSQFPNGAEQWFVNTEAFARASQKLDGPLSDYWHNHSLYAAREREINCFVFGSDIALFSERFPGLRENPDTAQACVRAWMELDQGFTQ